MDRIRRALEVFPKEWKERGKISSKKAYNLIVTERIYSIPWDRTFSTNHKILYPKEFIEGFGKEYVYEDTSVVGECNRSFTETDNPENIYYEAQCFLGEEVIAIFTMSGEALLSDLAALLTGSNNLTSKVFFVIEKTIYLKNIDESSIKFATMMFQLKIFDIKKWDFKADKCIKDISKEIYFHDGRFLNSIRITRMFFSQRRMGSYVSVKHLHGRAQLCKCCLKNNAVLKIANDPILPEKKKFICRKCFEHLFLSKEGNQRYEDVVVEFLH